MECLQDTRVENKENEAGGKDDKTIGAWVLVKIKNKKDSERLVHFIGQVTEIVASNEEIMVNLFRRKEKSYILPELHIRRGMHTLNRGIFCTNADVLFIIY